MDSLVSNTSKFGDVVITNWNDAPTKISLPLLPSEDIIPRESYAAESLSNLDTGVAFEPSTLDVFRNTDLRIFEGKGFGEESFETKNAVVDYPPTGNEMMNEATRDALEEVGIDNGESPRIGDPKFDAFEKSLEANLKKRGAKFNSSGKIISFGIEGSMAIDSPQTHTLKDGRNVAVGITKGMIKQGCSGACSEPHTSTTDSDIRKTGEEFIDDAFDDFVEGKISREELNQRVSDELIRSKDKLSDGTGPVEPAQIQIELAVKGEEQSWAKDKLTKFMSIALIGLSFVGLFAAMSFLIAGLMGNSGGTCTVSKFPIDSSNVEFLHRYTGLPESMTSPDYYFAGSDSGKEGFKIYVGISTTGSKSIFLDKMNLNGGRVWDLSVSDKPDILTIKTRFPNIKPPLSIKSWYTLNYYPNSTDDCKSIMQSLSATSFKYDTSSQCCTVSGGTMTSQTCNDFYCFGMCPTGKSPAKKDGCYKAPSFMQKVNNAMTCMPPFGLFTGCWSQMLPKWSRIILEVVCAILGVVVLYYIAKVFMRAYTAHT